MSGCGTSPKCQERRVTAAYWLKPDKLAYDGLGPDLTLSGQSARAPTQGNASIHKPSSGQ